MSFVRHWWRECATSVVLCLSLWLSLGTLAVTNTHAARIGLLPPLWTLGITAVLGVVATFWRSTPHRWLLILPAALPLLPWLPLPAALSPLLPASVFLWVRPVIALVWAALAIAWLADTGFASTVLVGTGLAGTGLAGTGLAGTRLAGTGLAAKGLRLLQHPVHAPLIAAGCAFVVFAAGAARLELWLPGGDEPHYLVITQSLLYNGDLQIEKVHRAGHYHQYIDRDLRPDYLRRGADGQIYSIHAPGLPALILPAFAIGGYRGAVIFLAIAAALGTALVWRLCFLLTGRADAAWIGWAAMTGSVPVFFHAFAIYPDGLASIIVLSGMFALVRTSEVTSLRAWLHGLALALLPWLHTRFAILAASLGLLIVWRLWHARPATSGAPARPATPPATPARPATPPAPSTPPASSARPRSPVPASPPAPRFARLWRIALFLSMPCISAIAWLAFFYAIYGELNPTAPYGSTMQGSWQSLPGGFVGLLIDQQFGLIANAPIFVVSLVGLGWMGSRRGEPAAGHRRLAWDIAVVAVPYALAASAYPMWWGGWSAPARFLVPIALLFSAPVAIVWSEARTQTTRACVGVALGITIWLTLFMLAIHTGRIAFNDRDGYALWADWAGPLVDLATALPSLFRGPWWQALGYAAIWAIACGAAWLILRAIERRHDRVLGPMFAATIVPTVCGVVGMIACSTAWWFGGVSPLRPEVSQLQLLERLRGGGDGAIDYATKAVPRLIPVASVPDRLQLDALIEWRGRSPFRPVAQPPRSLGPGSATVFAMSEGIYFEPGGFWIGPGSDHALVIAASSPVKLTLRNAPVENQVVTMMVDRWRRDLTLAPNEQIEVKPPAAPSGRTLLQIRVARGVRPANLDPHSGDHRELGVWVELR